MAKKEDALSIECVRQAFIKVFLKYKHNAEEFAKFTELNLAAFICKHVDPNFAGIYSCTDHNFYDRVRNQIANNAAMREEDEANDLQYSVHLKTYSDFLQSKAFKNLLKQKINTEGNAKPSKKQSSQQKNPSQPKERQMTEGEKKHVEFETAHRNPALRQACIDKYGYQCQCCGMNFADLYGEELGNRFIEVHHLKMISTYDESKPGDYVENLVPLCSNCHSMIHHGKDGPLTLGELRAAYKGEKKELKVRKED